MTDSNVTSIGERIRLERQRLGLTQRAFAITMQVSKGTQVGYETGVRVPDFRYFEKAQQAGVDIIYLMTGQAAKKNAENYLDWKLHDKILHTIETWTNDRDEHIPFGHRMFYLRMLMSYFDDVSSFDEDYIDKTLTMAKELNHSEAKPAVM